MNVSPLCRIVGASLFGLAMQAAVAQSRPPTTEQLGRDPGALRQEAEQQRAQQQRDQQRQSQQQADQQYNDTLRQQQSRAAGDMAQAEAVRRTWQQRPPLAPEKNPLLGRWESLGAGQRKNGAPGISPEMAQLANALIGGLTGGLCDSMLGRGTIEFRPAGVVAIGSDGRERPMYRAEYRGGGSRVVVLPQGGTTFTHMIIDFDGADRATVAAVGCGLARAGGGGTAMAAMTNTSRSAQAAAQGAQFGGSWDTKWGDGQAVLDLIQTGAEVTGTYAGTSQGKVTGRIAGKVLTGRWTGSAPDDKGGFVLNFSADGKSFTGTWGTGTSRNNGGPWVGARK
ncbi:MAG TPA: hypothetical protein VF169_12590 [Albitalea sp.]|uniref:hypothetical protein n=1 Tax=Piscinibacter sp. TaxID=1903157 RepID=UPI002ED1D5B0